MDKRQPSRNAELGLSTRAIHHGYDPAEEPGALTPPIFMTSTYAFESAEAGSELFRGERAGYIYGRTRSPTQALLESRLASLEGGEAALAVASGMGAISATMWTLLSAGDSVVIDRILYGNTFAFFTKGLTRFGVNVRLADFTDPDALAQALAAEDKLKLVYFETPANPNLRIIDIARVSSVAKSAGALSIVDNTDPDSAKSAQARRRPRRSFGDEISWRPWRSAWRRGRRIERADRADSRYGPQGADRRDALAAQRLFDLTRAEDAGSAHGAPFALRSADRRVARTSPARVACRLSWPQVVSPIRACATPDETAGRAHCV
jgi:hypothetical protein